MKFGPCSPFLIVSDLQKTLHYYRHCLGFEIRFMNLGDDPFFAIVGRKDAQIMFKMVDPNIAPLPNRKRHFWAALDIFIYVSDPDSTAEQFKKTKARFGTPLATREGLHGFEIIDPDGYVIFFGRPWSPDNQKPKQHKKEA